MGHKLGIAVQLNEIRLILQEQQRLLRYKSRIGFEPESFRSAVVLGQSAEHKIAHPPGNKVELDNKTSGVSVTCNVSKTDVETSRTVTGTPVASSVVTPQPSYAVLRWLLRSGKTA